LILIATLNCKKQETLAGEGVSDLPASQLSHDINEKYGQGALLLTRFSSFEEFKKVVSIQYAGDIADAKNAKTILPQVQLTYNSGGKQVTSILKSGISQTDFLKAQRGTIMDKMILAIKCPFAVLNRKSLTSIESLGRRRPELYGKGDGAFYDLADIMVRHLSNEDILDMSCEDLDEKGYLNSFNHITAQAFMTSIYSEKLADFVADVHELYNMPELITGKFTHEQLVVFENGPTDNYVDMINNEWGQELGSVLRDKYSISDQTFWTPELLTNFLNDIQSYFSWAFQIGFSPFRPSDEMVIQFSGKMNQVILCQ
jgi:hypothetical protein